MNARMRGELDQLKAKNADGLLVPEEVVKFAKSPKTALHTQFEWDQTRAAHQHRLWQARHIIRVVVTFEASLQKDIPVWVSLESDRKRPGGGYRTRDAVMSDVETRTELLQQALKELTRVREKYEMLSELAGVFAAIDAAAAAAAKSAKAAKKRKASKRKASLRRRGSSHVSP